MKSAIGKIGALIALLLALAGGARGQGSLFTGNAWRYTPAGIFAASGASVTVCTSAGTGTPCTPTITVYKDSALLNAVANPLPACVTGQVTGCIDGFGNFSFYAPTSGPYTYTITGSGLLAYGPIPITASLNPAVNLAFTGSNTMGKLNGVCIVDGVQNATLSAAVTCAGTNGVVDIPMFAVPTLTANVTIPAGVTLTFEGGSPGLIQLGNFNLAINGPIVAPNAQIFSYTGSGTVSFGGAPGPISPVWFSGATTDVKFANACSALPSTGGILDARGFGPGNQSIAATVQCGSSTKPVKFDFDPSTIYQPSTAAMNMFQISQLNEFSGLHIDTTNQATYSGDAIANAAQGLSVFRLDHTYVNEASGSTGTCLHFNGTSGSIWVEFGKVNDFTCLAGTAADAIKLQNSGGGWVNSVHWSGIHVYNMQYGVDIQQSGAGAITGNIFNDLECEHSSLPSSLACVNINAAGPGGQAVARNQFYINSWDLTAANKGVIVTAGSNGFACGNLFTGTIVARTDNSTSCSGFDQNVFWDLLATAGANQLELPAISLLSNLLVGPLANIDFSNSRPLRWKNTSAAIDPILLLGSDNNVYVQGDSGGNHIFFQPNGSSTAGQFNGAGSTFLLGTGWAYDTSSTGSYRINGFTVIDSSGSVNASSSTAYFKIKDEGSCTMSSGACSAQTLGHTYTAAPLCFLQWNGSGTLTGILKAPSTTTTVTPASSVGSDTAVVNWFCSGS